MDTGALPELAAVRWRKPVDAASMRRTDRLWTASIVAQVLPPVIFAAGLTAADPILSPLVLLAAAWVWVLPALYAARGARVLAPASGQAGEPQRRALGLLGDLLDHERRALYGETGLVLERGRAGTWLVGEAGAVLVAPGGRRVWCLCVRIPEDDLPGPDRTSHLLLALRSDETGLLTVANLAFSGATWRLRRRLPSAVRPALRAATQVLS